MTRTEVIDAWHVAWILAETVMEPKEPERTTASTDERKTIDLCGEQHRGARCFRERGHAGQHECPLSNAQAVVRWG